MHIAEYVAKENTYEPAHNKRYIESWNFLERHGFVRPNQVAIELGGNNQYDANGNPKPGTSVFANILNDFGKMVVHECPVFDLRYAFPLLSEQYDLVTCMEVMEHIKDREEPNILAAANFTGSGITNMLKEAYRITKPDGLLFLTTPNVCSWKNLYHVIIGQHPYFYTPHNRELSVQDVGWYVRNAGWRIEVMHTVNVWNNHRLPDSVLEKMKNMITDNFPHLTFTDRADDIFCVARKPK